MWGAVYGTWAALKLLYGLLPTLCVRPPIADFALLAAAWELLIGVGVYRRETRRIAAIAGAATNLGFIALAFIADARGVPWEGCGCVFVGIEFPWLPGHAIFAAVLALPFLAIVVRSERRLRRTFESAEDYFRAVEDFAARLDSQRYKAAASELRSGMACIYGLTHGWAECLAAIEAVERRIGFRLETPDREELRVLRDTARRAAFRR